MPGAPLSAEMADMTTGSAPDRCKLRQAGKKVRYRSCIRTDASKRNRPWGSAVERWESDEPLIEGHSHHRGEMWAFTIRLREAPPAAVAGDINHGRGPRPVLEVAFRA
eukprot:scaffold153837_cov36-Tisochrysis_lutea.AAC.2